MRVALVGIEALDNEAISDLVDRSMARIADGWVLRPGLLDYLREWYSTWDEDARFVLVSYYLRWAVCPRTFFIVVDDDEAAMLGLLKPELDQIVEGSFTMERFRTEVEDFFVTHEAAQTHPRLQQILKLACRRHPYQSVGEIIAHNEVIKDAWRDTPRANWGPPFGENTFNQAVRSGLETLQSKKSA